MKDDKCRADAMSAECRHMAQIFDTMARRSEKEPGGERRTNEEIDRLLKLPLEAVIAEFGTKSAAREKYPQSPIMQGVEDAIAQAEAEDSGVF